jgi:hypothetical protein
MDAASLRPYLPPGGESKALVTSNAHAWRGIAEVVELQLWPKGTGADYLIARTGRKAERAAAEALSTALGGLPLAHEQAASYCDRLGISFEEYKKRFEAAPVRLLDTGKDAPGEYHGGLTVAKTFALAIDEAAKLHPAAEPLIIHAALLAPEPIPLFLFSEAREKFGEPLASALADDGLDEAVAALRSFALVDKEAIADERDPSITTDCIRLHRLVREVAAARAEGKARENMLGTLVEAMAAVLSDGVFNDPNSWPRAPRFEALVRALDWEKLPLTSLENFLELSSFFVSWKCEMAAALNEVSAALDRVIAVLKTAQGLKCPVTTGDIADALPGFECALANCEKVLGPGNPNTKNVAKCTASVLDALGRADEAAALRARFGLPP